MGSVNFYEFAYLFSHSMSAGGSFTVVFDTIIACLWPFVILLILYLVLNKYVLKSL